MFLITSRADAETTRRRFVTADGLESSVVRYFGLTPSATKTAPADVGALYPVAFRVEQDPGTVADPHFHQANQFQVFVDGDGFLGKRPVRALTVQFAAAYTPYGPIVAGERGVAYLTLRNGWDPGALYMPGARDRLKAFERKPRAAYGATEIGVPPPVAGTDVDRETLIAPEADGLGAWCYRVPPNGTFTGPDPSASGGQYWVCFGGADTNAETPMQTLSCLFLSPDEPARRTTAGPNGLVMLVMQFPRLSG
jgi:hypothetical protein